MTAPELPTRRGFVGWLATALAAVPFLGGIALALRAAGTPAVTERPSRIRLCRADEVPADGLLVRPVSYRMRRGPRVETVAQTVFVTRDAAAGTIVAMSSRCTHLGCPVVHKAGDAEAPFHCPCHDAKFSRTGDVLDGPPTRPLDRLPIDVDAEGTVHLVLS